MKLFRLLFSVSLLVVLFYGDAKAGSTINPNVPAQNSTLSSAVVRGNFTAAYNDVSNILGKFAGSTPPTSPTAMQDWVNTSGGSTYTFNFWNPTTGTWVQWGSMNVSTGVFSSSASVAVNSSLVYTGTTLGINPAHSNTFTLSQAINLNTASLQTPQTGTIFQVEQANGTTARIELDAYAAVPRYTCVRKDGTGLTPIAIQSADELCSFNAFGFNGTAVVGPMAAIRTYAAQAWSVGATGTYMRLGVTPNGSATLTDAVGIEQNGGVTVGTVVGTSAGPGTVNISGNYYVNGSPAFTTVNGVACALGTTCTITAAAGTIAIGTTTISGGPGILYNATSGGVLQAYTTTGTAGSVVLSGSPTFTGTPILSTPTAASIALGGASIAGNALAVTGTAQFNNSIIYGGVTLLNGVTGTGNMVLDTSATLNTPTLITPTISAPVLSGTITGTYSLGGTPSIPGSAINSGTISGSFMSAINLASTSNGGVTGILPIANGGSGQATQGAAFNALAPTPTRVGDVLCYSGSTWATLAGNNSGTQVLTENASGVCSWSTITGVGTVTSVGLTAGSGVALSGTNPITSSGAITINGAVPAPQGRITLAANTPVMGPTSCSGTACANQSTLRYDCFNGGQVPYFNGTTDLLDSIASCEVTDVMVAANSAGQVTGNSVFDVWWVHSGANRICLAMSSAVGGGGGWASDTGGSNTARGTGYTQIDQVTRPYATNKNSITNCFNAATNYGPVSANQATYLGTIVSVNNGQTSYVLGSGASGGGVSQLYVWNMYNKVDVKTTVNDTKTSWSYASATVRLVDASSSNAVAFVSGLPLDTVTAWYYQNVSSASSGGGMRCGFAMDAGATGPFDASGVYEEAAATTTAGQCSASNNYDQFVGLHTLQAYEQALNGFTATVATAFGAQGLGFGFRM